MGAPVVRDGPDERTHEAYSIAKSGLPAVIEYAQLEQGADAFVNGAAVTVTVEHIVDSQRALTATWQDRSPFADFQLYGQARDAGDDVFALAADSGADALHVGGPSGLLLTVSNDGTITNRGSPRDGFIIRLLADQAGNVWGLGDGVILFWTAASAQAGLPPDSRGYIATSGQLGGVVLNDHELIFRRQDTALMRAVDADNAITFEPVLAVGGGEVYSDGAKDMALASSAGGLSIVEIAPRTGGLMVRKMPLTTALSALPSVEVPIDDIVCPEDQNLCVLDYDIRADGQQAAILRFREAAPTATTLELYRCATAADPVTCAPAILFSIAGARTDLDGSNTRLRLDAAGNVVVTLPGSVLVSPTVGDSHTITLSGAGEGATARVIGDCLFVPTVTARTLWVAPLTTTDIQSTGTLVTLDGQVFDVAGVDGRVLVAGGGEETQSVGAAHLYEIAHDGSCSLRQENVRALGHQRSQADLRSVAVRESDGSIFVTDHLDVLWQVPGRR